MKKILQKARLFLTSVKHSKYFTIILIFLIALTAGIVIIASQQQKQIQINEPTNKTDAEPLYMVDPGTDTESPTSTCNASACYYWNPPQGKCIYKCTSGQSCIFGECYSKDSKGSINCNSGGACPSGLSCISGKCINSCGLDAGNYCTDCTWRVYYKYRCNGTRYEDHREKDVGNCKDTSACVPGTICGSTSCTSNQICLESNCYTKSGSSILCKTGNVCPFGLSCVNGNCINSPGGGTTNGGTGGTTGGGITENTSCSRCSDTYSNVKVNWQEGDSTCDRSNVIGSTTYSLDCTCINDTQYGKKATLPSSNKNIDSSKCSPRCSDTYAYCKTEWNCTTPDCSDTWNAKYVKDCSCTQGTSNCNTKGIDTSSCTTSSTPPETANPFDCTGTKDGYQYKCDSNCNTTDGWNSSAYNNMTNKTTCQKDSKLCCYKKTGTTTAPQIPDCDSGIQYGECTGAQTNTCSQDNGTRAVTYTTHTSGKQCNQKSLYSQACTQSNCSFNYTCNSGQCVTVTTGGGNTGGDGNTNRQPTTPTILTFNLGLDGIGSAGDHINPDATDSNKNPKTTVRKITVSVLNSTGVVAENTVDANYDSETGKLSLSVDLGTSLSTGVYTIKAKSDGYLRKNLSTTQNITAGQTNSLPNTNLIVGDINNDNTISILDYNILISCSLFSKDNEGLCGQNGTNKTLSDLDDDGTVNQYDYSLFVREFSAQKGD